MKRDSQDTFGSISRLNHWVIALAMVGMLGYGLFIQELMPRGPEKFAQLQIHKALGVLIFAYAIWRVAWRLVNGFPRAASPMPGWQHRASQIVHWALILGILVMPASGMTTSLFGGHDINVFGAFTIPGLPENEAVSKAASTVHDVTAKVLIAVILLHIVGALKHHLIDKDATLIRMVSGKSER